MSINLTVSDVLVILGMFGATTWTLLTVFSRQQKKIWEGRHDSLQTLISGAQTRFDTAIAELKSTTGSFEKEVSRLEKEILSHRLELAENYAKKEDLNGIGAVMDRRLNELGLSMQRVEDKLDRKVEQVSVAVAQREVARCTGRPGTACATGKG